MNVAWRLSADEPRRPLPRPRLFRSLPRLARLRHPGLELELELGLELGLLLFLARPRPPDLARRLSLLLLSSEDPLKSRDLLLERPRDRDRDFLAGEMELDLDRDFFAGDWDLELELEGALSGFPSGVPEWLRLEGDLDLPPRRLLLFGLPSFAGLRSVLRLVDSLGGESLSTISRQ